MEDPNKTQLINFELSGLTEDEELVPFLFTFFLLVYLITIVGKVGMMVLIYASSSLHTPMYYFLSCLSLVDLFYSSITTPKMLADLLSFKKSIYFFGCVLQIYFYSALASTEVLLLSSMSYDRYLAICQPLNYISAMSKNNCFCLAFFSFSIGFLQSSAQTSCVFSLQYCKSNIIDHFYCEIPPLLKLSCSNTFRCNLLTIVLVTVFGVCSLMIILVSYVLILYSILNMKSSLNRRKAFSTCSSHLTCSTIFYMAIFLTYLHPSSGILKIQDKWASVFYSIMTPMLNPLIYSLRNQEVKRVIRQVIEKCSRC
ncbi:olfactory receptor 5AR1-like [Pyxicephalus adspersus]|uniref:olfactory receptor 5AR1-like n=1 Tax=Pyxicephalus adspersus TaxID=30357 RepID=UPI003B5A41BF